MTLNRDDILGADDLEIRAVEVPEWGGEVLVRPLTTRERGEWEVEFGDADTADLVDVRERLVAMTAVDEDGERLFTEDDVEALSQKSAAAVNRVFTASRKLSGLTEEAVEELAGN